MNDALNYVGVVQITDQENEPAGLYLYDTRVYNDEDAMRLIETTFANVDLRGASEDIDVQDEADGILFNKGIVRQWADEVNVIIR